MPNNSKKSLKDIKGSKIHPHSRKAAQINRVFARTKRIEKIKKSHKDIKVVPIVEKFIWFRDQLGELSSVSLQMLQEMVQTFIERNDQEIAQLQESRKHGAVSRPKSQRQTLLELLREKEFDEYNSRGIEVPDITQPKNVIILKSWNKDYQCIDKIKTIFIKVPKEQQDTKMN